MSRRDIYVKVVREEGRQVIICDACGIEAPDLEPGMYHPNGWYRIAYGIEVIDACSIACAMKVLEKFGPIDPFTMIQEVPPSVRR
jgi:hypothetical protein